MGQTTFTTPGATAHPASIASASQQPSRSVGAAGGIAFLMLVALAVIFTIFGLRTGLWALPVFIPCYGWMACCAVAKRTIRPGLFAKLHAWRLVAIVPSLAIFVVAWPSWASAAHAAWARAHGGIHLLSTGSIRFPFATVIGADPALFVLLCVSLVLLGMIAMPGHPHAPVERER